MLIKQFFSFFLFCYKMLGACLTEPPQDNKYVIYRTTGDLHTLYPVSNKVLEIIIRVNQ